MYADWEEKEFTIIYNTNGGNAISQTDTLKWTDTIVLPETPTKEGYTFDGWWTKASGGTQITNGMQLSQFLINDNNAVNHTIYAHWTENS